MEDRQFVSFEFWVFDSGETRACGERLECDFLLERFSSNYSMVIYGRPTQAISIKLFTQLISYVNHNFAREYFHRESSHENLFHI